MPTIPEALRLTSPSAPSSPVALIAVHGVVTPDEYSVVALGIGWQIGGSSRTSSGSGAMAPRGHVSGSRNHPACMILI